MKTTDKKNIESGRDVSHTSQEQTCHPEPPAKDLPESELTPRDLALYLGCKFIGPFTKYYKGKPIIVKLDLEILAGLCARQEVKHCKPILRSLSDMTEIDAEQLALQGMDGVIGLMFKKWMYHGRERIGFHYEKWTDTGGTFIGSVIFNGLTPVRTRYLLQNHYDLFGWIDAGLAIDAETLAKDPYTPACHCEGAERPRQSPKSTNLL